MTIAEKHLRSELPPDSTAWAHKDSIIRAISGVMYDAMLDYMLNEKINFADTEEDVSKAVDEFLGRKVSE